MTAIPALAATARRVLTFAVVAVLATACMSRPESRDEGRWTPRPGEAADWDWQIDAPYELDEHRAMYDLDLAARMGCDGVEPDQNNPLDNRPGFPITRDDQVSWYREVAAEAHARGLSAGMKNGHDQPGAVAELVGHFDWALPEECAQYGECARLRPFVEAGKAVFAVDYAPGADRRTACRAHRAENVDGLIKTAPPTGEYRKRCG
ncbi:hypothetical protein DMB38_21425 [Streptomyces sp. WAC 06738]|uniref:endo alpha-1,4 polygalactosaminidase n=1 Tax=Streptomyces sp. WAC 06738 TaxID=2203210 RepID=UPI000F6FFF03|nr:endo alpha-1,4 polygalactosaminidase [Streptomyces sp. WAC 06738]AZM48003.1 hypothetical protein DMB38_21425 [Streptomyces sp. WAC 06738]